MKIRVAKKFSVIASEAKQSLLKYREITSSFFIVMTGLIMLLILFSFNLSFAQNGVSTEQIEIVKAYQPLLADAVMTQFSPSLPAPDTSKPQLTYDVPGRLVNVPYSPALLKPIAMPKERPDTTSQNYAKVGVGTQWTPLLDVSLNNGVNGKDNYGLNLYHINQNGVLYAQDYSINKIQGYYTAFLGGAKFSADAGFNRNVVYFYNNFETPVFRQDDLKQTFSEPYIDADFTNEKNNSANFNYDIKLGGFAYFDRWGATEVSPNIEADLEKTVKDVHHINLDISYTTDAYSYKGQDSSTTLKQTNSVLSFTPFYNYKTKTVDITAGLTGSLLDNQNETAVNNQFIILPHFNSQTEIISNYLVYYAGWTGWIQQNNLLNLTIVNPFINENPAFQYSQVQNSFTGFKGSVGSHFSYDGRYSYISYYNMPFYVTDSSNIRRFNVVYDRRTTINELHAELGYNANEHFNATFTMEYFEYNLENQAEPWGMPTFVTTLGLNYNLSDKIYLKADIFTRDRTFDEWYNSTYTRFDVPVQNKGAIDANLSATYNYSQFFNFFINLNNITGQRYSLWYGYPSYGINILVGADVKF